MPKQLNTPVLLIGFNRPDLTARVMASIKKVKPRALYFAVDGPRNDKEQTLVKEVQRIIGLVDWQCVVKTKFQDRNLGCKFGPVAAMDWFFTNEKMGIILEDDVLADPSFFYFAQELLHKYRNNQRVGSISGNNFQFGRKRGEGSYYFSRYSHSCGWATWRRAWKLYNINITDYQEKSDRVLGVVFKNWPERFYWKLIFNGIRSGKNSTAWDYQWNWMMWKNIMLGIIPNDNLVENIGFGRPDATHTKFRSIFSNLEVKKIDFPLVHPKNIFRNRVADDFTQRNNYVLWKELAMYFIRRWKKD